MIVCHGRPAGCRARGVILRIHLAVSACQIQPVRFADLPAQARVGCILAITVAIGVAVESGIEAAARTTLYAQRVVHCAAAARKARFHLARAAVACAHAHVRGKSAFAFSGENLHHARHGVRAVYGSGRATHDLDVINLPQRNRLPRRTARGL